MSIVVHSKTTCPYCTKAKQFLIKLGLTYQEVLYDPTSPDYEERKNALVAKSNMRTFPQIYIGNELIGGYDDLVSAHDTLKLHEICAKNGICLIYDF